MENSNNLSNSILQSSEGSTIGSSFGSSSGSSDSSGSGFFGFLTNINFATWIVIILILAFLGFNIFVYLAKGTQDITSFFSPLVNNIFGTTLNTAGQVVDVSAEGAKAVVGGTANTVNTGLTAVQNVTPGGLNANSSLPNQSIQSSIPQQDQTQNTALSRALNTSQQTQKDPNNDYEANEASSSVIGKAGWCYIGEDRGFRTCSQVGVNDVCMSGDIFPSNEICINPNLRP
jgi:preprotein translocase subunit SecG